MMRAVLNDGPFLTWASTIRHTKSWVEYPTRCEVGYIVNWELHHHRVMMVSLCVCDHSIDLKPDNH